MLAPRGMPAVSSLCLVDDDSCNPAGELGPRRLVVPSRRSRVVGACDMADTRMCRCCIQVVCICRGFTALGLRLAGGLIGGSASGARSVCVLSRGGSLEECRLSKVPSFAEDMVAADQAHAHGEARSAADVFAELDAQDAGQ
jgi:hypothetical protein